MERALLNLHVHCRFPCHLNQIKVVKTQTFPQPSGFLGFRLMSLILLRLRESAADLLKACSAWCYPRHPAQFEVFQPHEDIKIVQQFRAASLN
jgi:hypothetical protein